MIRLIATDLDGTLLSTASQLPQQNIDALKRAMNAGVRVTISSGRMIEATLPIARQIGVNAPMSLFNGAMIYDMDADRILAGKTVPREAAVAVLKRLEALGAYTHAFPGRGYYLPERCAWTEYYENKIGVRGTAVGMPLSQWLQSDVYKLLTLGEPEQLDRLIDVLQPDFPQLNFVKSGKTHLEIVLAGVDKADGMRGVSAATGIAPEEMMAFGDEMNDLPMLQYCGVSYAMENAVEGVRSAIKLIAPKNTDSGVARIVNMYLDEGRMEVEQR